MTSFVGAYVSYFLDGATGGIIVVLQTLIFLVAFVFAPKHGMLAARRRAGKRWKPAYGRSAGDGNMIDTLLLPFQFPFMQQAFVIAVLVAVPTALLSCFLVLKGWSLMGDADQPCRAAGRRARLYRRHCRSPSAPSPPA